MVNVAEHTLNEVDLILWLVEPTDYIGAGEQHIIEMLKNTKTPVILVIDQKVLSEFFLKIKMIFLQNLYRILRNPKCCHTFSFLILLSQA